MQKQADIEFFEGDLVVKTLSTSEELVKAHRLRHKVFAETLRWVAPSKDGQEVDYYDLWGTSIGLVARYDKTLLGLARFLPASGEFMLERDLRMLLPSGHVVRKDRDTAEITRLALDPAIRKSLSARLLLTLIKGIYQWALVHDVRYFYLEVEHRFFRMLHGLGIPCDPLGPPVALPPAGALSVAATMDIMKCEKVLAQRRPRLMEWMATTITAEEMVVRGPMRQYSGAELSFST